MPIKALYVDDEPALLEIVKLFLERSGEIEVDLAPCVGEAERSLLENEYEVIISDYQMPGTNGIEFLRRLRSRDRKMPFILFTGRGREDIVIEALNSGADFYMQKGGPPAVQFAELENCVKQCAQRYRSERTTRESEEHFRCLVDNSFEGVGVHIDRVLIEANNAFCGITGYERGELIGKSMEELYTPSSWKVMLEHLDQPTAEPYDVQIVRKDGTAISVKTRGKDIAWKGRTARLSTILDLTERRDMEEQLMEKDSLIQNLVETSPDIVWEIDECGMITYISPRVTDILGYGPAELLGRPVFHLVAPDSVSRTEANLRERLRDRREFTSRIEVRRKDGTTLGVEVHAAPFPDAGARMRGFRGIGRALAAARPEEVLGTDGLSNRSSFETSPLGILIFDRDGFLADVNPAAMALFGLVKKEEAVGSLLFDHVRESRLSPVRCGKIARYTTRYKGRWPLHEVRPGEALPGEALDITIVPHNQQPGGFIGYEVQVRKIENDVLKLIDGGNALLNSILDSSSDAIIFALDRQYRYLAYNERHAEVIRQIWGREIAIGTSMLDALCRDDDRERAKANFDRALAGERLTVTEEYGDLSRPVWRDHYSPMLSRDGEVLGLTCHCLDVTEWERTKRELEDANHKLRIVSSITRHDVLNQLTALQGYLELERRRATRAGMGEIFEKMLQIADNLAGQINQAKECQDIGARGPEWQSVSELCRWAREQLDTGRAEVRVETDGLEIHADPLLRRVFYNLMDNSLKHGQNVGRISIRHEMSGPGLKVIYQDDGAGIDPGMRERLFTEGGGKDHGLGLFLAQDILKITGITIRETGGGGAGARFELEVPSGHFRFREPFTGPCGDGCEDAALLEPQHLGRRDLAGASRCGIDAQQRG